MASVDPKVTPETFVKFVPVITTAAPPLVDPVVLVKAVIVGAARYVY